MSPCPGRGAAFFIPLRRAGTAPNTILSSCPGLSRAYPRLAFFEAQTWMAGTSPAMTRVVFRTAPALQRTALQGLRAALRPGHGLQFRRPHMLRPAAEAHEAPGDALRPPP